ncbi:MAG TPA: hypothetical protein VGM93_00410 [Acidimicrobiales bacterium]
MGVKTMRIVVLVAPMLAFTVAFVGLSAAGLPVILCSAPSTGVALAVFYWLVVRSNSRRP